VVKRFLFALIATAFIGANLPMFCLNAPVMQGTVGMCGMGAPMNDRCPVCPDHAPASDLAKITCGAFACAGIVGLPARELVSSTNPGTLSYPLNAGKEMVGISLAPDPFPPRPTVRV
jgi:hypothetical protein